MPEPEPESEPDPRSEGGPLDSSVELLRQGNPLAADEHGLEVQALQARLEQRMFGTAAPPKLGHLQIIRTLGHGGMGRVYLAHDPKLDRNVAVKCLRIQQAGDPSVAQLRLLKEAQGMARVSHQNVAQIYEVFQHEDQVVLVMEYLEGETLETWLTRPHALAEVLHVYLQIAKGLVAIHERGLTHRDIKPANILLAKNRVAVADFGLVALQPGYEGEGPVVGVTPSVLEQALTHNEGLVGTPAYMAPEQLVGEGCDRRTDQFAFGLCLYRGVCQSEAFPRFRSLEERLAVLRRHRFEPATRRPPAWLWQVLERTLAYAREERFPDMRAVVRALEHGRRRRFFGWTAAGMVVVILLTAVATTLAANTHPCANLGQERDAMWSPALAERVSAKWVHPSRQKMRGWARLRSSLEQAASTWLAQREGLCQADTAGGPGSALEGRTLAAQRTCLGDRGRMLRAVRDQVLGPAGEDLTTPQLHQLADHLDGELPCSDPRALEAFERRPGRFVGGDAETAQARQAVADATTAELVGDFDTASTSLAEVLPALEGRPTTARYVATVGLRPLAAEALYRLGHSLGTQERGQEAIVPLTAAAELGEKMHLHHLQARARIYLAKIAATDVPDLEAGKVALGQAKSALNASGEPEDGPWQIEWMEAQGLLAALEGDFDGAAAAHRASLNLRQAKTAPGEVSLPVSRSAQNLANALGELGNAPQAAEFYELARQHREALLEPEHPDLSVLYFDMGVFYTEQFAATEALEERRTIKELATRYLDSAERLDRELPATAALLRVLAAQALRARDFDEPEPLGRYLQEIAELHRQLRRANDPAMASSDRAQEHLLLGAAALDNGAYNQAHQHFAEANKLVETPDNHLYMGICELELGRRAEARVRLRRVVDRYQASGASQVEVAQAGFYLAQAQDPPQQAVAQAQAVVADLAMNDEAQAQELRTEVLDWLQEQQNSKKDR